MSQELERTEELLASNAGRNKKKKLIVIVIVLAVLAAGVGVFAGIKLHSGSQIKEQLKIADAKLKEGKYEEAIAAYDKVIRLDEKNAEAYEGIGDAYMGLKQPDKALDNYRRSLENSKKKNKKKKGRYFKVIGAADEAGDEDTRDKVIDEMRDDFGEEADDIEAGINMEMFLTAYKNKEYDKAKSISEGNPEQYKEKCVSELTDDEKKLYLAKVKEYDKPDSEFPQDKFLRGYYLTDYDNDGKAELIVAIPLKGATSNSTLYVFKANGDKVEQIAEFSERNYSLYAYPNHDGIVVGDTDTSYMTYGIVRGDGSAPEEIGTRTIDEVEGADIDELMMSPGYQLNSHFTYNNDGTETVDYSDLE